ncbi:AI-2E family transporter [Methylocystis sp. IM3]|uniref:AI-2E family transporter n=1 Tax=unclassified Methylocystis TaxID=2625913 RepID=UPI0030FC4D52
MTQTRSWPFGLPAQGNASGAALAIVFAISVIVFHEMRWALLPFVLAGLLAYLLNPLVNWISSRFGFSRIRSAVAVFAALVAIVIAGGWLGLPPLWRELGRLVTDLRSILEAFAHSLVDDRAVVILGKNMDAAQIAESATSGLRDWIAQTGRATELATLTFAAVFGSILVLVLLFYLLVQGPEIVQGVLWLAPPDKRQAIERVWARLGPLLWRYVLGVLIVVASTTLAAYVGLGLVLGLKHAFFLALLTGFLEMVPVLGPGASALIGGLVAIQNATGLGPVVAYALYVIFLRLTIDQLLGPLVLGAAATLSPVVIIFCFLVGGTLFGVPGIILAAPVALTIKTSLVVLRDEAPVG